MTALPIPPVVDAPGTPLGGAGWASSALGLAVQGLPAGWEGRTWRRTEGRVLRLSRSSGVTVSIDAGPWDESLAPSVLADCFPVFQDEGPFEAIPAFGATVGIASCRSMRRMGPVRETWIGRVGDSRIEVSVVYPLGTLIAERPAVDVLLGRIVALGVGVSRPED